MNATRCPSCHEAVVLDELPREEGDAATWFEGYCPKGCGIVTASHRDGYPLEPAEWAEPPMPSILSR